MRGADISTLDVKEGWNTGLVWSACHSETHLWASDPHSDNAHYLLFQRS